MRVRRYPLIPPPSYPHTPLSLPWCRSADYFGTMLSGTWAHLKRKGTDGKPNEPVIKFTAKADGTTCSHTRRAHPTLARARRESRSTSLSAHNAPQSCAHSTRACSAVAACASLGLCFTPSLVPSCGVCAVDRLEKLLRSYMYAKVCVRAARRLYNSYRRLPCYLNPPLPSCILASPPPVTAARPPPPVTAARHRCPTT